jgi:hypothetical protein
MILFYPWKIYLGQMTRKLKRGIAVGAICLLICSVGAYTYAGISPQPLLADCFIDVGHWFDGAQPQPVNRNPAYSDSVVKNAPIRIDLEQSSESEKWIENSITVTNPRDVAVTTKIALNYTPFKWNNGVWSQETERTAITLDDVVVAPHDTVQFTVPVKPETNAEKGLYRGIQRLISVDEWNRSDVPAYKSVIVMIPPAPIFDNESDVLGGCADRIDNDGDEWVDLNDTDCPLPCNCDEVGFRIYNREGDLVYVDCEHEKCWTATALFSYSWGPPWVNVTKSCIQKGFDYPACNYCDDLEYGGFSDWILPDKDTLMEFANSSIGSCSDRGGYADEYWTSTPTNETHAYCVHFGTGKQGSKEKTSVLRVRCVRG